MQQSQSGEINDDDKFIRILIDPTESERLQVDLKPGTKLVPQGLKFAFVGNNATDWTVYADTLLLGDNATRTKQNGSQTKKDEKAN